MKKKKGYALLYTLAVIILLEVLAMGLLSVAASNRITTSSLEKSNQLKVAAESGADMGIAKLKQILFSNGTTIAAASAKLIREKDVGASDAIFNILNGVSFSKEDMDNNIKLDVSAKEAKRYDPKLGKDIACVQITSIATLKNNPSKKKTVIAYLDERDMTNVYYDRIFNNYSSSIENDNSKVVTNDTLNSLGITVPTIISTATNFCNYSTNIKDKDFTQDGFDYSDYNTNFENTTTMKIFKCENDPTVPVDVNKVINLVSGYINNERKGIIPDDYVGNTLQKLKDNGKINNDVDLSKYFFDENDLSYTPTVRNYVNDMIDYTKKYKMIVINGDASLKLDFPIVNYIIYCTGTLTIEDSDNNKLYNCSVIASKVVNPEKMSLYGITNPESKNKIFDYLFLLDDTTLTNDKSNTDPKKTYDDLYADGIKFKSQLGGNVAASGLFPSEATADFSVEYRTEIFNKFAELMDGFDKGYRFRIVEWKESN